MKKVILVDSSWKSRVPANLSGTDIVCTIEDSMNVNFQSQEASVTSVSRVLYSANLVADAEKEAFDTAQAICEYLEGEPRWRELLLRYCGYNLYSMAYKSLALTLITPMRLKLALSHLVERECVTQIGVCSYDSATLCVARDVAQLYGVNLEMVTVPRRALQHVLVAEFKRWAGWGRRFVWDLLWSLRGWLWRARVTTRENVILFLPSSDVHVRIMARALSLLSKQYDVYVLKYNNFAWPSETGLQLDNIVYWQLAIRLRATIRVVRRWVRILLTRLPNVANDNASHWVRYGVAKLRLLPAYDTLRNLETMEQVVKLLSPKAMILLEELLRFGKSVAAVGERLYVPTIDVQHGMIMPPLHSGIDMVYTCFAAFGEETKATLVRHGANPARIAPVGPLRYDRMFMPGALKAREQVAKDLRLDSRRPIVVFATQPVKGSNSPAIKRWTLEAIGKAANRLDVQLVLKLHPLENDGTPQAVLDEYGWNFPIVQEYDLYDLLNACDLLATSTSATGMEAVMLDKPVFLVNLTGNPSFNALYHNPEVALEVFDRSDVLSGLRACLFDEQLLVRFAENRPRFIKRHMVANDGHSSERLVTLVDQIIERFEKSALLRNCSPFR